MNIINQESQNISLGVQATQLISKNSENKTNTLDNISENLNKFLLAHSLKTSKNWKTRHRMSGYFSRDIQSMSSSTHNFLCGPLNTSRLTRKAKVNFDDSKLAPLSIAELYKNFKQPSKPPWVEPFKPDNTSKDVNMVAHSKHDSPLKLNTRLNFLEKETTFFAQPLSLDSEVPDTVYVDLQPSCPLYDSCEYESSSNQINERIMLNETCFENNNRNYLKFFDEPTTKNPYGNVESLENVEKAFHSSVTVNNMISSKLKSREEMFKPLVTSPKENGYSVFEFCGDEF